jgi:hypothetical protein
MHLYHTKKIYRAVRAGNLSSMLIKKATELRNPVRGKSPPPTAERPLAIVCADLALLRVRARARVCGCRAGDGIGGARTGESRSGT